MSTRIAELATEPARTAWLRLRDALRSILGDDLVAIWAYGSVIGSDRPKRAADLDTHVILRHRPDEDTPRRIVEICDALAEEHGIDWDIWFVVIEDARRGDHPPHAFRNERRDTAWALHRAHWLAGRVVTIHGPEPSEIVPAPSWAEVERDLDRELEHIERHVAEGETDPYEASYAVLNGSRVLRTLETRNPVLSKREAGAWALEHLPERWGSTVQAALRAYDEQASDEDGALLAGEMASFVGMVRERLPLTQPPADYPRWSGY